MTATTGFYAFVALTVKELIVFIVSTFEMVKNPLNVKSINIVIMC